MSETCPECQGPVEVVQRLTEVSDGIARASFLDEISVCAACGDEFYTYDQSLAHSRAATSALREAQGFMSPDRIRAARLRLGMTLAEFERALGVGPKTAGRWERGTVLPSRAANFSLWVAERYPEVFVQYAKERGRGPHATMPRDNAIIATILLAPSDTDRPFVLKHNSERSGHLRGVTGAAASPAGNEADKELMQV